MVTTSSGFQIQAVKKLDAGYHHYVHTSGCASVIDQKNNNEIIQLAKYNSDKKLVQVKLYLQNCCGSYTKLCSRALFQKFQHDTNYKQNGAVS